MNDNFLPGQKAEEIPDTALFEYLAGRCKGDQRACDIRREIADSGVGEESLEFLPGKGRFHKAVHDANLCRCWSLSSQRARKRPDAQSQSARSSRVESGRTRTAYVLQMQRAPP